MTLRNWGLRLKAWESRPNTLPSASSQQELHLAQAYRSALTCNPWVWPIFPYCCHSKAQSDHLMVKSYLNLLPISPLHVGVRLSEYRFWPATVKSLSFRTGSLFVHIYCLKKRRPPSYPFPVFFFPTMPIPPSLVSNGKLTTPAIVAIAILAALPVVLITIFIWSRCRNRNGAMATAKGDFSMDHGYHSSVEFPEPAHDRSRHQWRYDTSYGAH